MPHVSDLHAQQPQAPQPHAYYGDCLYGHQAQAYHQEVNYDLYSYETRQSYSTRYFPGYPHDGYPSPPQTLHSPDGFSTPSPSQISTYSSLSNALDGPVIVRKTLASSEVAAPIEQPVYVPPLVRKEPPMGMLPLESPTTPPTPPASTPSSASPRTPTLSPSTMIGPQTFEVIQDDSAFPQYDKTRKVFPFLRFGRQNANAI